MYKHRELPSQLSSRIKRSKNILSNKAGNVGCYSVSVDNILKSTTNFVKHLVEKKANAKSLKIV